MPEGTWEFVCHPGYVDAGLGRGFVPGYASPARKNWRVLTSPDTRAALEKCGAFS